MQSRPTTIVALALALVVVSTHDQLLNAQDDDARLLETLVEEYEAYGLPHPSPDATLVRRKFSKGTSNGVQRFGYDLVFREPSESNDQYWEACRIRQMEAVEIEVVAEPSIDDLEGSDPTEEPRRTEFYIDYDLALAIQCQSRGWHEIAQALLNRSRRYARFPEYGHRIWRPVDDHEALAQLAWNHWCNVFIEEDVDRNSIIEKLKAIPKIDIGLSETARQNVIQDMAATVQTNRSDKEKVGDEAWQDSEAERLINFLVLGQSDEREYGRIYRKLLDLGPDAIPTLLAHANDFRISHGIRESWQGRFHDRIADIVIAQLNFLKGVEPSFQWSDDDSFAFDDLVKDGRGKAVDTRHVMHWWAEENALGTLELIKRRAIVKDKNEFKVTSSLIYYFGRNHPDEFLLYIEENISKVIGDPTVFRAVEKSSLPDAEKIQLFLTASAHENRLHRANAIEQLFKLEHEQALTLFQKEVAAIPETPKQPYWLADTRSVIRLIRYVEDDQVWLDMEEKLREIEVGHRLELLDTIAGCGAKDERVLRFIVKFLDDDTERVMTDVRASFKDGTNLYEGPVAGFIWHRLRVQDFAAELLSNKLDVDRSDFPQHPSKEYWDKLRLRVIDKLPDDLRNEK